MHVYAAGNDGLNNDYNQGHYWSYMQGNQIGVSATDRADELAYFSSYGAQTVLLGAPGVSILSTIGDNDYSSYQGTSMASPHVAGAAALLKSIDSSLTPADIITLLTEQTDDNADLQFKTLSGGRLNIGAAMQNLMPPWIQLDLGGLQTLAPGEAKEIIVSVSSVGLSDSVTNGSVKLEISAPFELNTSVPITLTKGVVGTQSSLGFVTSLLKAPVGLQVVSKYFSSAIKISWDSVTDAEEYVVQRKGASDASFSDLATTSNTNYSDTTALPDVSYQYRVAAKNSSNTGEYSRALVGSRTDRSADIKITGTSLPDASLAYGAEVDMELLVENQGPNEVQSGQVRFSVPAGLSLRTAEIDGTACEDLDQAISCPLSNFTANSQKVVKLNLTATELGSLSGNVSVSVGSSDAPDPDLSNNNVVFATTIAPAYDLVLKSNDDLTTKDTSKASDFAFSIFNSGPSKAENFTLDFSSGEDLGWYVAVDRGSCVSTSATAITCSIDSLDSGETANFVVQNAVAGYGSASLSLTSSYDITSFSNQLTLTLEESGASVKKPFSFDIDESGSLSALTDGLLVIRHLFDFTGDTLVANATDSSSSKLCKQHQ